MRICRYLLFAVNNKIFKLFSSMDRNYVQRPSLWSGTFENPNNSIGEVPPTKGLKMAFNQRNPPHNQPPHGTNNRGDEDENLDNNFFDNPYHNEEGPNGHNISNSNSRVHSIHRNKMYNPPSSNLKQNYEARTGGINARTMPRPGRAGDMVDSIENHANLIVYKMEQDPSLMEDSPAADELRRETLRDMPQCLTLKRCVKVKLSKSVSQKSKRKPLSCYKMFKYRMSLASSRFKLNIKTLVYSFELWYGALKQIEGNFGSGVASFFKFMRWMFVMDLLIAILSCAFIIAPQITFDLTRNSTSNYPVFQWDDIFTGQGYLTNTFLYYGYYSNSSVGLSVVTYSMPDAYFFTMVVLYLSCLAVLSFSVAGYYRRSFIETEGGLKNVYAHKIFCGWDYNIATNEAAQLKSRAIYNELKELLYDAINEKKTESFIVLFWTRTMQVMMNILMLLSLFGAGYLMWFLMDQAIREQWSPVLTAVAVNTIMTVFPMIYSWIIIYEGYRSPKKILSITLIRTFLLGCVLIGVLVTFWLKTPKNLNDNTCWETSLGQEIYRLILFDFIFSVILTPIFDLLAYGIHRWLTKGYMQFDVARHTMQIIYNQTLFWVGFFFSPFLAVIVTIKLLFIWYVRKFIVLKLCKPSSKSWRAAQTTTWFLMMAFLSLLLIGGLLGYIITYTPTTSCGPFGRYQYIFEIVTLGLLQLRKDYQIWKILLFVTKPGFIALVLIALSLRVYYLRAKAQAQRDIVAIYREMLVWESRDKEFLLQNISQITKGKWQYNLQESRELDPVNFIPNISNQSTEFDGSHLITRDSVLSNQFQVTTSSTSSSPTSSTSFGLELDKLPYSQYKKFS